MPGLLLIALLAVVTASANPTPIGGRVTLTSAYLNSESLLVSVSPTDAVFSGSFTFAASGAAPSNSIAIYLWLPEEGVDDPAVGALWKALGRGDLLATNAVQWEVLDRTVGLRIRVGERKLKLGSGINYFSATHYRPPVPPNPKDERLIAIWRQRHRMPKKPENQELLLSIKLPVLAQSYSQREAGQRIPTEQEKIKCMSGSGFTEPRDNASVSWWRSVTRGH